MSRMSRKSAGEELVRGEPARSLQPALLGLPTAWSVVACITSMSEDDLFRDPFAEFLPSGR